MPVFYTRRLSTKKSASGHIPFTNGYKKLLKKKKCRKVMITGISGCDSMKLRLIMLNIPQHVVLERV